MPVDELGNLVREKEKASSDKEEKWGFKDGVRRLAEVKERYREGHIGVSLAGTFPSNLISLTQTLGATARWQIELTEGGFEKIEEGDFVPKHHRFLWRVVRWLSMAINALSILTLKQDSANVYVNDKSRVSQDEMHDLYHEMGYE